MIPERIQRKIAANEIGISPIVTLELQYLFEIGRVGKRGMTVVQDLVNRIGLQIDNHPSEAVVGQAIKKTWTRDPFDRLIVGQPNIRSTTIVTKDVSIHQHYKKAIW